MAGPSKIFPTLFVGDYKDGSNVDKLFDLGITHVLSVGDALEDQDEDIVYQTIKVLDMEDQNIMKHFDIAYKFIEKGRNNGACLIHCNAGVSRAPTICIAYLMKKLKISLQDATETVSDVRPQIAPNAGFVRQLEQYYLNLHPELKKTTPKTVIEPPKAESSSLASTITETSLPDISSVSLAPQSVASSSSTAESSEITSLEAYAPKMVEITTDKTVYGCKMCRRPLFTADDIMPHQVAQHNIAYKKRDKGNSISTNQVVCSSLFLQEPLQWMGNVDENEGKICCIKCQNRVGFWKWDGLQCSCGTWVTPAIQIAKNRVDERVMAVTTQVPADS